MNPADLIVRHKSGAVDWMATDRAVARQVKAESLSPVDTALKHSWYMRKIKKIAGQASK